MGGGGISTPFAEIRNVKMTLRYRAILASHNYNTSVCSIHIKQKITRVFLLRNSTTHSSLTLRDVSSMTLKVRCFLEFTEFINKLTFTLLQYMNYILGYAAFKMYYF